MVDYLVVVGFMAVLWCSFDLGYYIGRKLIVGYQWITTRASKEDIEKVDQLDKQLHTQMLKVGGDIHSLKSRVAALERFSLSDAAEVDKLKQAAILQTAINDNVNAALEAAEGQLTDLWVSTHSGEDDDEGYWEEEGN